MLLKSADDKSPRVQLLERLVHQSSLSSFHRQWVREELIRLRKGVQGEREAAYYLDSYFKDGQNHVVLHDLRFVVDGETAQIDHLVLNRLGLVYLIETKNYAGNLLINEQGEFTVEYDTHRFGIPSPIEQSQRHERILIKLLEQLDIGARLGQFEFQHVVLLHPKATIVRPPEKTFDTSMVIKADQFPTWHRKFADQKVGLTTLFKGLVNQRSTEELKAWGEMLVRQHRPADQLTLPEFITKTIQGDGVERPMKASQNQAQEPIAEPNHIVAPENQQDSSQNADMATQHPLAKKLICVTCGAKISYAEGKFCWNNVKRFGGLQYCRADQVAFG